MLIKRFLKLRGRIEEMGVDRKWLASQLGVCPTYVSQRMTGNLPWSMKDVYRLCDVLRIPTEEIPTYFPRDGISKTAILELSEEVGK